MSRRFINCNVVHELLIFYPTMFSLLKEIDSKLHQLIAFNHTYQRAQDLILKNNFHPIKAYLVISAEEDLPVMDLLDQ